MLYWMVVIAVAITLGPYIVMVAVGLGFLALIVAVGLVVVLGPFAIAYMYPELGYFRLPLMGVSLFMLFHFAKGLDTEQTKKKAQVPQAKNPETQIQHHAEESLEKSTDLKAFEEPWKEEPWITCRRWACGQIKQAGIDRCEFATCPFKAPKQLS